ncbi:GlxA family transcriptional regulator [Solimicrobium silvestre]|uniref:Transcriptional regulator containing an amidase domain and an AraC-type DNA-binding HTH domain n=1 Tax=Solimicrobium silvestre TaxID=2099400 RepID=A0A2S9H4G9_9BURK|nr:helix-turn-helix domain-containing protein [Solimicrobium silvestre]PRC94831.1 Transcriptional regulator containing an amidase domain and an AraC-type DNA-binding HTH domain [Solimicrobium silvestre]
MQPFLSLACSDAPIRIALLHIDPENGSGAGGLSLAGLVTPLRLVEQQLGAARIIVTLHRLSNSLSNIDDSELKKINKNVHLVLLIADELKSAPSHDEIRKLAQLCQQARFWGAVGAAVLWFANVGKMERIRSALPWALYAEANEVAEHAILMPNLFELDGHCLTCCGGAASIDFALTLIHAMFGADVQAHVMEALCVERVRNGDERQRIALQTRFGVLQPQLSEAVTLMENNIEETLSTDDIAQLVGLSRRQLERQFKQYLGTMPSRYYLELRLKKARQLLLDSNSSIVQIGLMCGFSSGAHFSTAFGTQFGITPREERQRKLSAG